MGKIFLALVFALASFNGFSQSYPAKPVRIIVPYPPGGGTDVLARLVGKHLGDTLKQSVLIENRAGGSGMVGLEAVAKSPADGYTLVALAAGPLNDDNLGQFAPIALFTAASYVMVVHPAVKANSVQELVALAKSQPGKLAYGSTGGGAASHLTTELFKAMTGTDMLHVPYKGVGSAVNDLLGGQVQLMIAPSQAVIQHVKAGKLRALAVTGGRRSPLVAQLPTIAEAGVAGYEATGWFGMAAPAGTPRDIVLRLNQEVNRILVLPEMKERLLELGAEPAQLSAEQFLEFIRADNAKWAKLIRERGIVIEKGS